MDSRNDIYFQSLIRQKLLDLNDQTKIIKNKFEEKLRPKKVMAKNCVAEGLIHYDLFKAPIRMGVEDVLHLSEGSDFSAAFVYFKNATTLDPKCASAWMMLGVIEFDYLLLRTRWHHWTDVKNYEVDDENINNIFERAIQLNSKEKSVWLARGLWILSLPHHAIYDDEEINDEGIKDLNKALELDPQYEEALLLKGDFCAKLKKFEDALSCYEKIIHKFPNKWLRGLAAGNRLDPSDHPTLNLIAALCHRGMVLCRDVYPKGVMANGKGKMTQQEKIDLEDAAFCFKIVCNLNSYSTLADVDLVLSGLKPEDKWVDGIYQERQVLQENHLPDPPPPPEDPSEANPSYGAFAEWMLKMIEWMKNMHDEE